MKQHSDCTAKKKLTNLSPAVFPQTCNLELVQEGARLVASLEEPL